MRRPPADDIVHRKFTKIERSIPEDQRVCFRQAGPRVTPTSSPEARQIVFNSSPGTSIIFSSSPPDDQSSVGRTRPAGDDPNDALLFNDTRTREMSPRRFSVSQRRSARVSDSILGSGKSRSKRPARHARAWPKSSQSFSGRSGPSQPVEALPPAQMPPQLSSFPPLPIIPLFPPVLSREYNSSSSPFSPPPQITAYPYEYPFDPPPPLSSRRELDQESVFADTSSHSSPSSIPSRDYMSTQGQSVIVGADFDGTSYDNEGRRASPISLHDLENFGSMEPPSDMFMQPANTSSISYSENYLGNTLDLHPPPSNSPGPFSFMVSDSPYDPIPSFVSHLTEPEHSDTLAQIESFSNASHFPPEFFESFSSPSSSRPSSSHSFQEHSSQGESPD